MQDTRLTHGPHDEGPGSRGRDTARPPVRLVRRDDIAEHPVESSMAGARFLPRQSPEDAGGDALARHAAHYGVPVIVATIPASHVAASALKAFVHALSLGALGKPVIEDLRKDDALRTQLRRLRAEGFEIRFDAMRMEDGTKGYHVAAFPPGADSALDPCVGVSVIESLETIARTDRAQRILGVRDAIPVMVLFRDDVELTWRDFPRGVSTPILPEIGRRHLPPLALGLYDGIRLMGGEVEFERRKGQSGVPVYYQMVARFFGRDDRA